MLLHFVHAFSTIFVSSLRGFPEYWVYNNCGLNCFIEYLHRKLLTTNFLFHDIESAKKAALIEFAY